MQESEIVEAKTSQTSLETKQIRLEEKASLLVKKISEVANENLELKDRIYGQKELYLKQEEKIRALAKEKTKLSIKLKSFKNSASERSNTAKSLSHEIHTLKTLVRYILSNEFTNFYYASYHIFMLPKILLFSLEKPSWEKIKEPIIDGLRGLKILLLMPLKIKRIYYYRKIKKENPLSKSFKENFEPRKLNIEMEKVLRKSWMLKQLIQREKYLTKNFPSYLPEILESPQKKNIRVASILDEFSYSCFQYECSMTQLDFDQWEEQIEKENFDLLLVESAWKGKNLLWQNQIGGLDHKTGSTLSKLVKAFKEKGIPTVFWNKEDPPHFKHFLESAKLFDHVFTSDENKIPAYKEELGHSNIESLSFACQPVLHNPIGSQNKKKGEVAFAGTWYENKHEKRKRDIKNLLYPALNYNLHIFDRMADHLIDNHIFPFEYHHTVQGSLSYEQTLTAYRKYKVFLNVNSVQDSKTMFSRRVYELMACGTNIISGPTEAFEYNFGKGLISEAKNEKETEKALKTLLENTEEREKTAHKATREALTNHTYTKRFEKILTKVGLQEKYQKKTQKISVFLELKKKINLEQIVECFNKQSHEEKELYIFTNSKNDLENLENRFSKTNNIIPCFKEKESLLHETILTKAGSLDCDFISFFKETNYYSPNFLSDFLLSFLYTDTNLACKENFYTYNKKSKKLYHKQKKEEHTISSGFNKHCFLAKKELFLDNLFREQVLFQKLDLKEAYEKLQYETYISDRFNYFEVTHQILEEENHDFKKVLNNCSKEQVKNYITI